MISNVCKYLNSLNIEFMGCHLMFTTSMMTVVCMFSLFEVEINLLLDILKDQ